MNEAFNKLPDEKRSAILKAAYNEFEEHGFKRASTNKIAAKAGIGKGTLFYYFGNKKKLYQYLITTSFNIAYDEYLMQINFDKTDYFDRLASITDLKQKVSNLYPNELSFLSKLLLTPDDTECSDVIQEKREESEKVWEKVLTENIDFSKFREDLPREKVLNLIKWGLEGYRKELEQKANSLGNSTVFSEEEIKYYYKEYNDYIDLLKRTYYKS